MMAFRRGATFCVLLMGVAFFAIAARPHQQHMQQTIQQVSHAQLDRVHMVVLGDSLAYGTGASNRKNGYAYRVFYDIKRDYPHTTYANLAVPGATSVDVLRYQIPRLRQENATLVVLTVGANDAFVYRDVGKFSKDYRRLLSAIRQAAPRAKIVVTGMPNAAGISHVPNFARTIVATMCAMQNQVIIQESAVQGALVIDLFDLTSRMKKGRHTRFLSRDELHPSDAGYAQIANAALPVVRAALRDTKD